MARAYGPARRATRFEVGPRRSLSSRATLPPGQPLFARLADGSSDPVHVVLDGGHLIYEDDGVAAQVVEVIERVRSG
jgi:hypothetical protein